MQTPTPQPEAKPANAAVGVLKAPTAAPTADEEEQKVVDALKKKKSVKFQIDEQVNDPE